MSVSFDPQRDSALLDVRALAALLDCSIRHVYRMSDAGKIPTPMKLGALVRWNRSVIEKWIADGCPTVRAIMARRAGQ